MTLAWRAGRPASRRRRGGARGLAGWLLQRVRNRPKPKIATGGGEVRLANGRGDAAVRLGESLFYLKGAPNVHLNHSFAFACQINVQTSKLRSHYVSEQRTIYGEQ